MNNNELRRYPLTEGWPMIMESGDVIPDSLICDLTVTVPVQYRDRVALHSYRVTPAVVSLSLVDSVTGAGLAVLVAGNYVPYRPYAFTPVVPGVSGFAVFGNIGTESTSELSGVFETPVPLDGHAVLPVEAGSITEINIPGHSTPVSGLVQLTQGPGVILQAVDEHTIGIGLVPGLRAALVGPCDATSAFDGCGGVPIRTINGVPADENGRITIEVH